MSRTEDIERVLTDPRCTTERMHAALTARGWRDGGPSWGGWIRDVDKPFPGWDYVRPHDHYEVINKVAEQDDTWWLDAAAAVLAQPIKETQE